MPHFTVPKKNQTESETEVPEDFDFELSVLVMAKKMSLSFGELNQMTMQEFVDFIDMWTGEEGKTREATQKDIDYFYSNM